MVRVLNRVHSQKDRLTPAFSKPLHLAQHRGQPWADSQFQGHNQGHNSGSKEALSQALELALALVLALVLREVSSLFAALAPRVHQPQGGPRQEPLCLEQWQEQVLVDR